MRLINNLIPARDGIDKVQPVCYYINNRLLTISQTQKKEPKHKQWRRQWKPLRLILAEGRKGNLMTDQRRNTVVRQKQIISAARKLIVQYGSEHLTIRRIAREIRVTEGALYRHFKSKRGILLLLADDIGATLLADIDGCSEGTPYTLELLDGIITNHIANIVQRKGVSFQVISEIVSLGDKILNRKIDEVINKYIARIRGILSEGIKAGVIRTDINLDTMATLFFCMTHGLVNMWALSNYSFSLEEKCSSFWSIFRSAIIKREI